jgi:hypothetical protein
MRPIVSREKWILRSVTMDSNAVDALYPGDLDHRLYVRGSF